MWFEEISDWLWETQKKKFTDEEVLAELKDVVYWARDKVNFRFRINSDLVDVYIWESLAYVINKNLYKKIMKEDSLEWNDYPFKNL